MKLIATFVALLLGLLSPVVVEAAPPPDFGWRFGFDGRGRIISVKDPAGRTTRNLYSDDEEGRPRALSVEYPSGGKVTQLFNKFGQRTRMSDAGGTVDYTYDKGGRLVSVRREGMPALGYGYDKAGRIKSITVGQQLLVAYEYDIRGRVEKAVTPAGNVIYRYGGDSGTVTRLLPNGITTRWTYRPNGRLASIAHAGPGNRLLARYDYAYRPDGLIEHIDESNGSATVRRSYQYDSVGRLTTFQSQDGTRIDYDYDKFGNRVGQRVRGGAQTQNQYDWAGRLTVHDGGECRHDAASNLVGCRGMAAMYSYGDTSQLESVTLPNRTIRYRYDGDGQMIGRTDGNLQESFVPDGLSGLWRPLVSQAPDGKETLYVWEGYAPLMAIGADGVRFMLHDHLGSVRLMAGQRGDVTERSDFAPFGKWTGQSLNGELQPGFAGLFFDKVAALYLTRARSYHPTIGAFLQPDPEHRIPKGLQSDLSPYSYCGGDPVNFLDLDGSRPGWATMSYWSTGLQELLNVRGAMQYYSDEAKFYFARPERLSVMRDFLDRELRARGNDVERTTYDLRQMRSSQQGSLTRFEWQLASNQMDARNWVANGLKIPHTNLTVVPKGLPAAVAVKAGSAYWGFAHWVGERFDSGPESWSFGLARGGWERQRIGTGLAHQRGIDEGLRDAYPRLYGAIDRMSQGIRGLTSAWHDSVSTNRGRDVVSRAPRGLDRVDWASTAYASGMSPNRGLSSNHTTGLEAAKVGGIRLSRANDALGNRGELEGFSVDERDERLTLISKGNRQTSLPGSRLDEVVTVFRSVYQSGEAPSVSIDPLSDRRTETVMRVRHGRATANTYVGWVLYEADRLMKAYQFGRDNRTKSLLVSQVPGYRALYGRGTATSSPVWERFWIVPASVTGERDARSRLTTLQVPLRVETERMEWREGKFQTARDPTPSPSAKQFTEWFTKNYDRIADEAMLKPPPECGVGDQKVPVFHELRRMALITAIAETLRDQNAPFPAWMRDYPVRSCPVDETTPVMRDVERGEHLLTGGVQLAVPEARRQIATGGAAPDRLARALEQRMAGKPILSSETFELDGVTRRAVTLPGSNNLRGGANILQHTDLVLPVGRLGASLALTRQAHSFFDPTGPFGHGWTLDLPELEKQPVPVRGADGRGVAFKAAFELTSPLNSWSARFAERRIVPELNAEMWVPSTAGEILGLGDTGNRFLGGRARTLVFRDGRRWYFDDDGHMVGHSDASVMVSFQRDPLHRIHVIRAWALDNGRANAGRAGSPDAQIALEYLGLQVKSAEGTAVGLAKPLKAYYVYGKDGRLAMVVKPEGKFQYTYQDGLLASVRQDDGEPVMFRYNAQGQLEGETLPGGQAVAYERTDTPQGPKVVVRAADDRRLIEAVQYDKDFRPTARTLEDGTTVTWTDSGKTRDTIIATPGGERVTVSDSADARRRTITTPGGATHVVDFDEAGRATTIRIDEGPRIEQRWDSNGRLLSAVSDTEAVLPSYTKSGALASVLVTPPQQAQARKPDRFIRLGFDADERVSLLEDDAGGRMEIAYDETGYPASIRSPQGAVNVARGPNGQVRRVDTSWGATQAYEYDAKSGDLSRITFQQRGAGQSADSATTDFAEGGITRIRGFDGGETRFTYYDAGSKKGLLQRIVTANDLRLTYDYDLRLRLTTVQVGDAQGGGYRVNYEYDSANRLTGISYSPVK